ncbi:hypothetical protein [Teredinibacter franksiae]|nr:hypothetical protein [Teredinibacter franksiae]
MNDYLDDVYAQNAEYVDEDWLTDAQESDLHEEDEIDECGSI